MTRLLASIMEHAARFCIAVERARVGDPSLCKAFRVESALVGSARLAHGPGAHGPDTSLISTAWNGAPSGHSSAVACGCAHLDQALPRCFELSRRKPLASRRRPFHAPGSR